MAGTQREVQHVLPTKMKSFNRPVARVVLTCGHHEDHPTPWPVKGQLLDCLKCPTVPGKAAN